MSAAPAWSSAEVQAIADQVSARTGLAFPPSRRPDIEAAISEAMARAGAVSASDFLASLADSRASWDDLVDTVTVRETYFFRDKEQLDAIVDLLVPSLATLRGPSHQCRVWSAGCASGEEPYSLAMLLDREGPEPLIHATDISIAALARAAEGLYGRWSLRATSTAMAAKYFQEEGDRFRLSDAIRRRVRFRRLNLASDPYPSIHDDLAQMDLILCKNVLIYLDAATIAHVARGLFATLAPGGWLAPGLSDPLLTAFAPFETVTTSAGLVYRRPLEREASIDELAPAAPIRRPPEPPSSTPAPKITSPRWTLPPKPEAKRTLLADRARALAKPVAALGARADADLIVFRVANRKYAIPLADALEVVRLREIAPIPGVPAPFAGITSLRGELIALVDVASLLGEKSADAEGRAEAPSKCLVIGAHGPELGLVADEILGAEPLGEQAIAAPPDRDAASASFGRPIARALTASGMVLLDVRALLADERLIVDHRGAGERPDEEQA